LIDLRSEDWRNITQNVTTTALPIFSIPFNTRLKSEIISSLFEIESAKYFQSIGHSVKNATTDHEPDLFFFESKTPLEIKVTQKKKYLKWMGNKVSKRESQFVLIAWEQVDSDTINYYITSTFLDKSQWSTDEYSYNASFLSWKELNNRKDIIGCKDMPVPFRIDR